VSPRPRESGDLLRAENCGSDRFRCNEAKTPSLVDDLGTIEDVVIDTRTNTVAYPILSFGGFLGLGDKKFAIPWRAIDFHALDGVAILNLDKERLKNAPGFKLGEWPDMGDKEWTYRLTHDQDAEQDWTSD
jgi:sporulation protein YlmC with PRC-barrel domain